MVSQVLFSKGNNDWATPSYIYNYYKYYKYVDPCPLGCEEDNLNKDFGDVDLFINPPYSNIDSWVDFTLKHLENHKNKFVVLLVPSRTDTKWFHKLLDTEYAVHLAFFKGRLKFGDSNNSAPFPSVLITVTNVFNKNYGGYSTITKDWFNIEE